MTSPLRVRRAFVPLVFALSAVACPARAQEAKPADPLPVRAVTLFSSGVSYTLREGEVSGNAQVPLVFRTTQINDILKSLVLLDERGTVQPAVYGAKDPVGRTLQSFAVDVSRPPSLAELLNQLRGARVVVDAGGTVVAQNTLTPKRTLEGQIVGVEGTDRSGGGFGGSSAFLSVLGDAGLQTVRLSEVNTVRLLDERLNREFREALTLLGAGSDDKRRSVQLRFAGDGKRRVRVGYVSEAPLWKISYRLLLGGTEAEKGTDSGKPYLQGWALVENTTDDDWNNVRLSLVSGRPVSFIQDLYQPLYLPRPVVPPDVVASPYPQLAEGAVETTEAAPVSPPAPPGAPTGGGFGGGGLSNGVRAGRGANRPATKAEPAPSLADISSNDADNSLFRESLRNSVAAQATGERAGELFQYNIKTPVSLPRQQAAMIPVIAQEIGGEKVSVFNADTGPRFPLSAFRVRNNTPLHLKGGPVTIFDNGVYAGDARMEDIPPGDNRLVTYAVDLSIEGDRQGGNSTSTEGAISIQRGVLITTRTERQETVYTLRSKSDRSRTVLVEHPYNSDFKLVQPAEALERTGNRYRFAVNVAPGKTEKLTVRVERPVYESVGLINADVNFLEAYATRRNISEGLRTALREIQKQRRVINDLQSRASAAEAEIAAIDKDQDRIRKNMNALDKASALYKRYTAQLDTQETRIEALRTEVNRLRNQIGEAERDLRAYLDTLDVKP